MLDSESPLFIRREPSSDGTAQICISVNSTFPYSENNPDPTYRDIKLKIFAAANAKEILDFIMDKSGLIDKPSEIPKDVIFNNPLWNTYSTYGEVIALPHVNEISSMIEKQGYFNSELLLNCRWEINRGDFKFHPGLFGSARDMINNLHNQRFRVKVPVYPIIYDPANQQARRELFVKTKNGALTQFIDFGNDEAAGYYKTELERLYYESGIDSVFITSEQLTDFKLENYTMENLPNFMVQRYIETVASVMHDSTSTLAFKTQSLPLLVQMTPATTTTPFDQLLQNLIPNALSISMAGYSFFIPYHIGGHWAGARPSEEIYIRMVQASTLMPTMSFSIGPWLYSQQTIDITRKMINLHAKYGSLFIELAKKRKENGTPIIRPMWYEAPDEQQSFTVSDQFMLGDDIIVAPVVEIGQRQRSVFVPDGEWLDEAHGRVLKGPGVFKVVADLEDLPHFIRKK
ncbi:hypothetical protein RDWZM_006394 [Blomia tropicalis]|uniref:Glycoside hydrolase family 31 protein n=1 Tax=Blomia tropicalis TaxID=40697 RepID=A0A9Q0M7U2_BLOTA|nr:hypothetical protein RDWZM_006394 [Blomia tropicalis]